MATSAIETAKQENGSKFYLENRIEKNAEPSYTEMVKVYDGYNQSWRRTYKKQTDALQGFLKNQKGYVYSRDTGIMPFIENIAKKEC